jgi:hypothetical protein
MILVTGFIVKNQIKYCRNIFAKKFEWKNNLFYIVFCRKTMYFFSMNMNRFLTVYYLL